MATARELEQQSGHTVVYSMDGWCRGPGYGVVLDTHAKSRRYLVERRRHDRPDQRTPIERYDHLETAQDKAVEVSD